MQCNHLLPLYNSNKLSIVWLDYDPINCDNACQIYDYSIKPEMGTMKSFRVMSIYKCTLHKFQKRDSIARKDSPKGQF